MTTTDTQSAPSPSHMIPLATFAVWGTFVTTLAVNGAFVTPAGDAPLGIILALTMPPILFLGAHAFFPSVRTWVSNVDLGIVTGLQITRTLGIAFVILWAFGELPAVFAFPAGLGDVAVALAAIPVTIAVTRQSAGWKNASRALVFAGLADFAAAIATGILSVPGRPLAFEGAPAPTALETIPMVLVPALLVPTYIILHVIVLIRIGQDG